MSFGVPYYLTTRAKRILNPMSLPKLLLKFWVSLSGMEAKLGLQRQQIHFSLFLILDLDTI